MKKVMKKVLIAMALAVCFLMFTGIVQAEVQEWYKFGFNDGSADMVYLMKTGKVVGGAGFAPITFVDGTLGIRIEYANELTGNMFDTDLLGVVLQADIVKAVKLIPNASWQLPDMG